MSRMIGCLAASMITFLATTNYSPAATANEAMNWLAGRWTNKGDCAGGWVQFQPASSGWIYREIRWNKGVPASASVSVDASGVVTVHIEETADEDGYEYVNTFRDEDSFDAVEGFTSGQLEGRRMSRTYSRCK